MQRPSTTEFTIGDKHYRIKRLGAMTGSWIANLLVSSALKSVEGQEVQAKSEEQAEQKPKTEEQVKQDIAAMWLIAGSQIEEETYARIQHHCLMSCSLVISEESAPLPVRRHDGRWGVAELEDDPLTINQLVVECLGFSLCSFFAASVSSLQSTESASRQPKA